MRAKRLRQPGTCFACHHRFSGCDHVIRTRTGDVLCARHRHMFVPEAVVASGEYRKIRYERQSPASSEDP